MRPAANIKTVINIKKILNHHHYSRFISIVINNTIDFSDDIIGDGLFCYCSYDQVKGIGFSAPEICE